MNMIQIRSLRIGSVCKKGSHMYIYYPSCNFTRLFPETEKRIRAYFETQPDVRIVGCCKPDRDKACEGDVIVTVCNSCMRLLEEMRPDIPQISLFELLLQRDDFSWPEHEGERILLQDCFRAREKHNMQDAVRACLEKMHYQILEMDENRDEASFDGSYLLRDPYPNNMELAPKYYRDYMPKHVMVMNEEEQKVYFKKYAEKFGKEKVVCYCNTCTSGAQAGGADAYHLAEIIFEK